LKFIICKWFNNHPRPVVLQCTADVSRSAHRIAHVMRAIEHRREVVICAGEFLGAGCLEGDSIGNPCALGRIARHLDGLVMIIKSVNVRLGNAFAIEDRGGSFATSHIGNFRAPVRACPERLLELGSTS